MDKGKIEEMSLIELVEYLVIVDEQENWADEHSIEDLEFVKEQLEEKEGVLAGSVLIAHSFVNQKLGYKYSKQPYKKDSPF